jgi:hypothetical protein
VIKIDNDEYAVAWLTCIFSRLRGFHTCRIKIITFCIGSACDRRQWFKIVIRVSIAIDIMVRTDEQIEITLLGFSCRGAVPEDRDLPLLRRVVNGLDSGIVLLCQVARP